MNAAANDSDTIPAPAPAPAKARRARKGEAFEVQVPYLTGGDRQTTFAVIEPGSSIMLHGACKPRTRYVKDATTGLRTATNERPIPFAVYFKVGDPAAYDGFNLTYVGTIKAIGPKTVTIAEPYSDGRLHRLSLERFAFYNWDFDIDVINKRNSEWMD